MVSGSSTNTIAALRPDDDARRTAIFKNSHLRLLMRLVGFEPLVASLEETPESVWIIPGKLSADQLKESLDLINKAEFDPPVFDNDQSAEDQLRRKSAVRKKAAYDDDDDDNNGLDDDDGILFPAGGPTARKVADGFLDGKKKRLRRRREGSEERERLTEEQHDERTQQRRARELEKARRIKSEMYVHASDDETDDERDRTFFEREEQLRQKLHTDGYNDIVETPKPAKAKRKSTVLLDDSDDEPIASTAESSTVIPR